ncbi:hypothetical protein [Actinoplanes sp. G11-F43]|uniref:hypothetical protein n=1 Tax=Actinoplanes sp. G11-F43 TaxID=3424130 RepID=UPI003D32FEC0
MTTASVLVSDVRVGRMAAAAVATGMIGGTATATLAVTMGGADTVPAALALAVVVPVLLGALIAWRLTADGPGDRWLAAAAALGVLLITVVQVALHLDFRPGDGAQILEAATIAVVFGSLYGLIAAVAAIVLLVPAVLVLRHRISRPRLRVMVTAVVMTGAAVFAYLVTDAMQAPALTGMATALAGVGAVIGTRS